MRGLFVEALAAINTLVLDVDGVLTDGGIAYTDAGAELKCFHVRDGSGLKLWHALGNRSLVITGRRSAVVERRAAELGVAKVVQGAERKLPALKAALAELGATREQCCAVGDDLPDLPLLLNCGAAAAVADACIDVRSAARFVTKSPGGRGAVRDVIEWLLAAQGRWEAVVAQFRGERWDA